MRHAHTLAIGLSLAALAGCSGGTSPTPDAAPQDGALPGNDAGDAGDTGAPGDAGVIPFAGVDDYCPGSAHCPDTGDSRLYVGAARAVVNPTIVESEWQDLNNNNYYDRGEPFTDVNHNGVFDATWIAGFGTGRPAIGQHDDLEVRVMALRYNGTTVVVAMLDAVGFFIDDQDIIRARPEVAALDVDRVIIGATHCHEGVDTIGIWGPDAFTTGLNPTYRQLVYDRMAGAIVAAVADLRPASMRVAQGITYDPVTGSTLDYVNDTRDPVIYDPTITIARFTEAANPNNTIATWVNWSSHPEYSGSRNNYLTADYVHSLRDVIENGDSAAGVTGLGGTVVFSAGALGGQVGPGGGVHVRASDGSMITDSGIPKAQAAGHNVALIALQALAQSGEDVRDAPLAYRTAQIYGRVENTGYHAFYLTNVFDRRLYFFDPAQPIDPMNMPWVRSRVSYLQVGPLATVTAPGELHPDLWVGTRDTHWSWGQPVITSTQNVPDLARAPAPPYLRDLVLANPSVRYTFVWGLAEDFLGYIVPAYNYVLNESAPYVSEAPGDHYEETNSIGPGVEQYVQHPMMEMARWRAPGH